MNAISFELEEKIVEALARELVKKDYRDWDQMHDWQKKVYKTAAKPFFNAMYDILREHD